MESKPDYIEDLKVIKKVMEESSRFLSLSGLSGLFAGLIALTGIVVIVFAFLNGSFLLDSGYLSGLNEQESAALKVNLSVASGIVLILAIGVSVYYSYRKASHGGLKIWTPASKRFLINFLVPLITGGIFILILTIQNTWQLIIPAMLIFYGLALVSAGKFTYGELFYLGILEIITGLVSSIFPAYGLFFWCFGFGILHITYGIIMYRKYE